MVYNLRYFKCATQQHPEAMAIIPYHRLMDSFKNAQQNIGILSKSASKLNMPAGSKQVISWI